MDTRKIWNVQRNTARPERKASGRGSFFRAAVPLLAAALALTSLSGCLGLNRAYPDIREYTLTLPPPETAPDAPKDLILKIEPLRGTAPYAEKNLVYQYEVGKLKTDYYHRFVDFPENLITEQIISWFELSGLVKSVIRPEVNAEGDIRIWGHVNKIYADFSDPQQPKAVMDISIKVFRSGDADPVISQRYLQEVGLEKSTIAETIKGFNLGLEHILRDLETSLAEL